MFQGGDRVNPPFPMGPLKVAVSGPYEGKGIGRQIWVCSTQTPQSRPHKQPRLISVLARNEAVLLSFPSGDWSAGGKIQDNMNPAGNKAKIYNAVILTCSFF